MYGLKFYVVYFFEKYADVMKHTPSRSSTRYGLGRRLPGFVPGRSEDKAQSVTASEVG
jgi:hypothetical protein